MREMKTMTDQVGTGLLVLSVGAYLWFLWDMRQRGVQYNERMVALYEAALVEAALHTTAIVVPLDGDGVIDLAPADEPPIEDGAVPD